MKLLEVVVFEETGEERAILGFCKRCERTWEGKSDPDHEFFTVVSQMGTAHTGIDYGMTGCGVDATGERWWWRL